jgi:ribose transport system permease protein
MSASPSSSLPTTVSPRRRRISALRDYGIVFSFIALFAALAFSTDAFLTTRNLLNILDQQAAIGIIACFGTLVLIAGGLDLSTGAVFAFAGIVAAETVGGLSVWGAMALAVAVSLILGTLNGLLATAGRINAIIATLATGIMIRGLAIATTGGLLVRVDDPAYATL